MPPYGEPDWATPGNTTTPTTTQENGGFSAPVVAASTGGNDSSSSSANNKNCMLASLSILNILLAAAMGCLGITTLLETSFTPFEQVMSVVFLSCYMALFATLLFCYELVYWQPFPNLNRIFRKSFGFMYSIKGKGYYMIFVAFLTIGLHDEAKDSSIIKGFNIMAGAGWLAGGILHVFLSCTSPDLVAAYKPPTAGLTQTEQQAGVV